MVVLRCTAKMLKRLKLGKEDLRDPDPSTTALGDWYASVIYIGRQPMVLAVSEKSLLPLLMAARDLDNLPDHFIGAVLERLQGMGIPETIVRQETLKMVLMIYAKTASRSVLGSMNDFAVLVKRTHNLHEGWSLSEWMDWLGKVPCKPIQYKYPSEVAREVLMVKSLRIV